MAAPLGGGQDLGPPAGHVEPPPRALGEPPKIAVDADGVRGAELADPGPEDISAAVHMGERRATCLDLSHPSLLEPRVAAAIEPCSPAIGGGVFDVQLPRRKLDLSIGPNYTFAEVGCGVATLGEGRADEVDLALEAEPSSIDANIAIGSSGLKLDPPSQRDTPKATQTRSPSVAMTLPLVLMDGGTSPLGSIGSGRAPSSGMRYR